MSQPSPGATRQSRAEANASAVARLPEPGAPVNRYAWWTRPRSIAARSRAITRSWPRTAAKRGTGRKLSTGPHRRAGRAAIAAPTRVGRLGARRRPGRLLRSRGNAHDLAPELARRPRPRRGDPAGRARGAEVLGLPRGPAHRRHLRHHRGPRSAASRPSADDWCNLGQGMPEADALPGAPPRVAHIDIAGADQEYAPVSGPVGAARGHRQPLQPRCSGAACRRSTRPRTSRSRAAAAWP